MTEAKVRAPRSSMSSLSRSWNPFAIRSSAALGAIPPPRTPPESPQRKESRPTAYRTMESWLTHLVTARRKRKFVSSTSAIGIARLDPSILCAWGVRRESLLEEKSLSPSRKAAKGRGESERRVREGKIQAGKEEQAGKGIYRINLNLFFLSFTSFSLFSLSPFSNSRLVFLVLPFRLESFLLSLFSRFLLFPWRLCGLARGSSLPLLF